MSQLILALAYLFLASGCLTKPAPTETPQDEQTFTEAGELARSGETLTYSLDEQILWRQPSGEALAYKIVTLGPPALLTTCGPGLEVSTWAVSATGIHEHAGKLPLVVSPPLVALGDVTEGDTQPLGGCVLLTADGATAWSAPSAELLWPADDSLVNDTAYCATATDGDLIYVFGTTPRLAAVSLSDGTPLWSVELQASAATADVFLWTLDDCFGLLHLQYDYERFEFVRFSRETGALGPRYWLDGQPAMRLVYPGPSQEPAGLAREDGHLMVLVYPQDGPAQTWDFELDSGQLTKEPAATAVAARREDNAHPRGGSESPGPGTAPFPQQLLPADAADSWRIPALCNPQGAVFVLTPGTPLWVSP